MIISKLEKTKLRLNHKETYFCVDMKLIFHFPTFPEPCCVAVRAGEKITTCHDVKSMIKEFYWPQTYRKVSSIFYSNH